MSDWLLFITAGGKIGTVALQNARQGDMWKNFKVKASSESVYQNESCVAAAVSGWGHTYYCKQQRDWVIYEPPRKNRIASSLEPSFCVDAIRLAVLLSCNNPVLSSETKSYLKLELALR